MLRTHMEHRSRPTDAAVRRRLAFKILAYRPTGYAGDYYRANGNAFWKFRRIA